MEQNTHFTKAPQHTSNTQTNNTQQTYNKTNCRYCTSTQVWVSYEDGGEYMRCGNCQAQYVNN